MSSECELDEGIKSIKSAWRREHTARANLEKMLEQAEAENAKLRWLVRDVWHLFTEHGAVHPCDLPVVDAVRDRICELGIEVD